MAATGLDVFDRTLQTTNLWLDELMETVGPQRQVAWHTLGAVLRPLRDRLPIELAAHLGAQLPLLVRGLYYDQWHPAGHPEKIRDADAFLQRVGEGLEDTRPVNVEDATRAVFALLGSHLPQGQVEKVRNALPANIRRLWPAHGEGAGGWQGSAGKTSDEQQHRRQS